ncbi:TRAP transporter small permease [Vibrio breoganii]|uniref:TRAP transporter small permease n=1 Tax=Vibrio breoganii TaxID=553239 RepID=UPI000C852869|nr:TRAP transporter small permease [Vibrio breoganii]PMI18562.1 C4-dicarboxylate ABC transporter permease [Vibrio breoganii]PMK30820.1 C4-dicarboxylate ABC transporter permease [Vibrio breoganii]PMK40144.1 C4-dicarboxylate ABC transporter permease [Vibrio breoganii]
MDVFFKGVDVATKILEKLLVFIMWAMVFTVVWQVFTRFVINSPSTFTDELSRYLLIWIGILGGAYVFALRKHLAIEILATRLSSKNQKKMSVFINLLVMTFSGIVFVYGGWNVVNTTLGFNQISPSLSLLGHNLPMGYVYMVAPISGVFIVVCALADIIKTIQVSE